MIYDQIIRDEEIIARILHKDWVVDGRMQINAFALRPNETYISVNRLVINTFTQEVTSFVKNHPDYHIPGHELAYRQAVMNVGDVRGIRIELGQQVLNMSVDVEPRNLHILSHAGIFTLFEGKYIKGGQQADVQVDVSRLMPVRAIHQKVQYALLALSKMEECNMPVRE